MQAGPPAPHLPAPPTGNTPLLFMPLAPHPPPPTPTPMRVLTHRAAAIDTAAQAIYLRTDARSPPTHLLMLDYAATDGGRQGLPPSAAARAGAAVAHLGKKGAPAPADSKFPALKVSVLCVAEWLLRVRGRVAACAHDLMNPAHDCTYTPLANCMPRNRPPPRPAPPPPPGVAVHTYAHLHLQMPCYPPFAAPPARACGRSCVPPTQKPRRAPPWISSGAPRLCQSSRRCVIPQPPPPSPRAFSPRDTARLQCPMPLPS